MGYLHGSGYNRMDHNGTVLLFCNTFDKDKYFLKEHNIKVNNDYWTVKVDVPYYGFEIRKINEN